MNQNTPLLFLVLAGLFVADAAAQPEDTFNLVAGASVLHDSNLFRAPSGLERSEVITGATVGVRFNKPYSLQRLTFNASLTDFTYQHNSQLNYIGKNADAAWLWSLTPRLHGALAANYNESLNSFVDYVGRQRNLRTAEGYRADLEWEAWGRIRLLAGISQDSVTNSLATLDNSDYTANTAEFAVKYQMPSESFVSLGVRHADGQYEKRRLSGAPVFNDTGYTQQELESRFNWVASGKSTLKGRLAYIDREHDHFSERNYGGTVGSLDYIWDIAGKLRLNLGGRQDLVAYQSLDASYYRLRNFYFAPIWQFGAKTALRARISRETRDYQGAVLGGLPTRDETWRQSQLAIDWNPLRTLTLSASLSRDSRESTAANNDFAVQTALFNANLAF